MTLPLVSTESQSKVALFEQALQKLIAEESPLGAAETRSPLQEIFHKVIVEKLELARKGEAISNVDTQNLRISFGFMELHQKMYQEALKKELEIKALYQDKNDERARRTAELWSECKEKELAIQKAMKSVDRDMQKLEMEKEEQAHRHHREELEMLNEMRKKQIESLQLLRGGVSLDSSQTFALKPLIHLALEMGKERLVKFYLASTQHEEIDEEGNTPLAHAILLGKMPLAVHCKAQFKVNLGFQNRHGESYMHLAACSGSLEMLIWVSGWSRSLLESRDALGRTPLAAAVAKGDTQSVEYLIKGKGANRFVRDLQNQNLLHCASVHNHLETLQYLLSTNVQELIESEDNAHQTPLKVAVKEGSLECAAQLVEHKATLLDEGEGENLVQLAASNGDLPMIHWLSSQGCDVKDSQAVFNAFAKGHGEMVRTLVHLGASLPQGSAEGTLLHLCGSTDLIDFLLANGFSLLEENGEGLTPLEFFIGKGRLDLAKAVCPKKGIKVLIEQRIVSLVVQAIRSLKPEVVNWVANLGHKIEGNQKDHNGNIPLKVAIELNFGYAITTLFNQGAAIHTFLSDGQTYLHLAARLCSPEIFEQVAAQYQDLEHCDLNGNTALQTALQAKNLKNSKHLVARKAKKECVNQLGETALHTIAKSGDYSLWDWFMATQPAIEVDCRAANGSTPLAYALVGGSVEITRDLLGRGAQLDLVNFEGNYPLHLVGRSGSIDLFNLVQGSGYVHDPNLLNDQDQTALEVALQNGSVGVAECLTRHYPNIVFATKLLPAVMHSPTAGKDCVEWLLDKKCDLRTKDGAGHTALYYAIAQGATTKSEAFLKHLKAFGVLAIHDETFLAYLLARKSTAAASWIEHHFLAQDRALTHQEGMLFAAREGLILLAEIILTSPGFQPLAAKEIELLKMSAATEGHVEFTRWLEQQFPKVSSAQKQDQIKSVNPKTLSLTWM